MRVLTLRRRCRGLLRSGRIQRPTLARAQTRLRQLGRSPKKLAAVFLGFPCVAPDGIRNVVPNSDGALRFLIAPIWLGPDISRGKERPDVFSRQTHWHLCLPPNRRKLSPEQPGASACVEHRRPARRTPSYRAIGCPDALRPALLRKAGGDRCACRRSDRAGRGATGRARSGLWPFVGSLAVGNDYQTGGSISSIRVR